MFDIYGSTNIKFYRKYFVGIKFNKYHDFEDTWMIISELPRFNT